MSFNPNTNSITSVSIDSASVGRTSTIPFLTVYQTRNPTANDVNYPIQQRWVNTTNPMAGTEFILQSYSNATGQLTANWLPLGIGAVPLITLTGNSGGAVGVDAGNNINVVGDGTTIVIAGNPGANTLTASTGGTVATQYNEDAGSAIPAAGILRVIGGTGVNTAGAGNTITINAAAAVPLLFTENAGTATPAGNNLNVFGGTGITTSGAGSTITINAAGNIATTYNEDAGSATPAANILRIIGGTGISTAGAGNTVTITNTSMSALTFQEDSGTATPAAGVIMIRGGTGISTAGAGSTVTISRNPPTSFLAYKSATTNNVTGDNANYLIIFDTIISNNGGAYNNATGLFTAPVTGLYMFAASVQFNGGTSASFTRATVDFFRNGGAEIYYGNHAYLTGVCDQTNGTWTTNSTMAINLTAGDTINIEINAAGPVGPRTVGIDGGGVVFVTAFSGYLIN